MLFLLLSVNWPIVLFFPKVFSLKLTSSTMQAHSETGIKPVCPSVAETQKAIFFHLHRKIQEKLVTWAVHSFFWIAFMEIQAVFDTHTIFFNGVVWVGWRTPKSI